MTSFAPQAAPLSAAPPDPTKQVNYQLGMVLGVADFMQGFAYHSGRDQWTVRDLLGYGTIVGLQVTVTTDNDIPQVVVSPGVAVNPQGQLIRIPATQCAKLNDWLALPQSQQELDTLAGQPSANPVVLQVVLSYSNYPTDIVPIPGQPCRSEGEAMVNSRLLDSFQLELRFTVAQPKLPDQQDEYATREFVALLNEIQVTNDPGLALPLDQFANAIRAMFPVLQTLLGQATDVTLPSPPVFTFGSPAEPVAIPAARVNEYMRTALRIWVTELRPQLRGQTVALGYGSIPAETHVLLAELQVPIVNAEGTWKFDKTKTIMVDETLRPYLLHLRLLQELLLSLPSTASSSVQHPTGQGDYAIVAAGIVSGDSAQARQPTYNGLRATSNLANGLLTLTFNNYTQPDGTTFQYVVKILPVSGAATVIANFVSFNQNDFTIRVTDNTGAVIAQTQFEFMIEVSRYSRSA